MEHLPIIDMHMHALELPPGESQTLMGLRSPDTPEEYLRENLALLEELNIRAVTSGSKELVRQWHQAAPERIISGIGLFCPDEVTLDWHVCLRRVSSYSARRYLEMLGYNKSV